MANPKVTVEHAVFKTMPVLINGKIETVDFNDFKAKGKKKIMVRVLNGPMIDFSKVQPVQEEDKKYLDDLKPQYELIWDEIDNAKKFPTPRTTYKTMTVIFDDKPVKIDFNVFEIKSNKTIRVKASDGRMINFFLIKEAEEQDAAYLSFLRKEYQRLTVERMTDQKNAEKKLSKRRVRMRA